jgi:hypothetical protein
MKTCSKCGIEKELGEFYKWKAGKDGLQRICKVCDIEQKRNYRETHKESEKLYRQINQHRYKDSIKNYNKIYQQKNKDYYKKYKKNNKDKTNRNNAIRRSSKIHRTPNWLTKQDYFEIELKYFEASEWTRITGIQFEVDHIIPLQGEFMSGLHVPWNLRVVTQTFNRSRPKNIKPFEGNFPLE